MRLGPGQGRHGAFRRFARRPSRHRALARSQAPTLPRRRAPLLPRDLRGNAGPGRLAARPRPSRRAGARARPRGRRDGEAVERFDLGERLRGPTDDPRPIQRARRVFKGKERPEPAPGRGPAGLRRGRRFPLLPAEAGRGRRVRPGRGVHGVLFRGGGPGPRPEPGTLGHEQRGTVCVDAAGRDQAGIAHPHAPARRDAGRSALGRPPRGGTDRLRGPLRRGGGRDAQRARGETPGAAAPAPRPPGRRDGPEGNAVADPHGRRRPGPVHRAELPRPEPEPAVRHRRHVLDQAGQSRLGLVVGKPCDRSDLQARHEHGDDEALHRLRRAPRARVHAGRRRLGADRPRTGGSRTS